MCNSYTLVHDPFKNGAAKSQISIRVGYRTGVPAVSRWCPCGVPVVSQCVPGGVPVVSRCPAGVVPNPAGVSRSDPV